MDIFNKISLIFIIFKEITNLLAIIVFTQYVCGITPASSMGMPRICNFLFYLE
jgi:hypothetical protein